MRKARPPAVDPLNNTGGYLLEVLLLGCMSEPTGNIPRCQELWHCNDSFQVYPYEDYPPDIIFQVHDASKPWGRKWPADWRKRYLNSQADIMLMHPDPSFPKGRVQRYPAAHALDDAPAGTLNSTLAMMIWYASAPALGISRVHIHGFALREPEYTITIPGVVRMIRHVEKKGVRVTCRYRKAWEALYDFIGADDAPTTMEYAGIREAARRNVINDITGGLPDASTLTDLN